MSDNNVGKMETGAEIQIILRHHSIDTTRYRADSFIHQSGKVVELRPKAVCLDIGGRRVWLPKAALKESVCTFDGIKVYSYELARWFQPDNQQNSILWSGAIIDDMVYDDEKSERGVAFYTDHRAR